MASFEQQLKGVSKRFEAKAGKTIQLTVLKIANSIIEMSPVGDAAYWQQAAPAGYVGGRFRANWDYGFNNIPRQQFDMTDKSGNASKDRVKSGIGSNVYGVHYVSNNLDYALKLENGWSRQAPNGMVKLTAMKFNTFVKESVR